MQRDIHVYVGYLDRLYLTFLLLSTNIIGLLMSRTKKFPVDSLWSALAASISSGTFTDTAYHLYSRRLPCGKIGAPRVVHANSRVLKAAGEYFVARELL